MEKNRDNMPDSETLPSRGNIYAPVMVVSVTPIPPKTISLNTHNLSWLYGCKGLTLSRSMSTPATPTVIRIEFNGLSINHHNLRLS